MNVHAFDRTPGAALAQALAEFETAFAYPLGPERTFHISHGQDYPRFFRAMGGPGDSRCFVAEDHGRIAGVLGVAVRSLLRPDGSRVKAGYLGDLKVSVAARGGRTLYALSAAAEAWLEPRARVAFGVVMAGTAATPDQYSGRAGIPAFRKVGEVLVLRWNCERSPEAGRPADSFLADASRVERTFQALSLGRYAPLGANPAERSATPPRWLLHPEGTACGCLEDTLRAKRLHASDGQEIVSAHLSSFAFRSPEAGADLLRIALRMAQGLGFPALFAAVTPADAPSLMNALPGVEVTQAPALVYGAGLEPDEWNISTSEI